MTHIGTKTILHRDVAYTIHIERITQGWTGYIVVEGEYYAALPTEATERDLMNTADKRIRALDK